MESGEKYTDKLLSDESLLQMLTTEGIFILEKRPDERVPDLSVWNLIRRKAYGATEVLFLGPNPQSPIRDPQSAIGL
jgi:16S rRNA G966 N2-methylase RsmD